MITGDQLICHLIGDYCLQSDWMATEKSKRFSVALIHASAYTLPFGFVGGSLWAMLTILWTHAFIDHFKLARYVVWAKEWLSPNRPAPLAECPTGYNADKPAWLAVWLFIIADNTMHLLINGLALKYL